MHRHVFLIPGFFGFANLGDFTYWGHVERKLAQLLAEAGKPASIYAVKSQPTASLRDRTRLLLETIASVNPGPDDHIHLIGHSTGGLDARLLLTPAVDLQTDLDAEYFARLVRSSISVATPHQGAPIASFFTSLMGRQLLRLLSVLTMAALRSGELPLAVWAEVAGMFTVPKVLGGSLASTLAAQLYLQLLADFNPERRDQVRALLEEVERDQSLLTQLTVESMDLFNAAAGDRDSVSYGSVITQARQPNLATALEIGLDPVNQAQHAIYYSLHRLAGAQELWLPDEATLEHFDAVFGEIPDPADNDGIVPTLSQPWGECIAAARADHLDIIGHYPDEQDAERHYDWLTSRSNFRADAFDDVWQRVVQFMIEAEKQGE
jgi:hypothetical protein